MKIDRIELFHVAIPLSKPFYPSWIPGYPQTVNRFTLLRLTTDDGVQGISAGMAFEREREGLGGLIGPYLNRSRPNRYRHGAPAAARSQLSGLAQLLDGSCSMGYQRQSRR